MKKFFFYAGAIALYFVSSVGTSQAQVVARSVKLTWAASTTPQAEYNVYRSATATGTFAKINPAALAVLTYTDAGVPSGTTLFYRVTAICPTAGCMSGTTVVGIGESAPSQTVSAVIPADPGVPGTPGTVTVTVTVVVGP